MILTGNCVLSLLKIILTIQVSLFSSRSLQVHSIWQGWLEKLSLFLDLGNKQLEILWSGGKSTTRGGTPSKSGNSEWPGMKKLPASWSDLKRWGNTQEYWNLAPGFFTTQWKESTLFWVVHLTLDDSPHLHFKNCVIKKKLISMNCFYKQKTQAFSFLKNKVFIVTVTYAFLELATI